MTRTTKLFAEGPTPGSAMTALGVTFDAVRVQERLVAEGEIVIRIIRVQVGTAHRWIAEASYVEAV